MSVHLSIHSDSIPTKRKAGRRSPIKNHMQFRHAVFLAIVTHKLKPIFSPSWVGTYNKDQPILKYSIKNVCTYRNFFITLSFLYYLIFARLFKAFHISGGGKTLRANGVATTTFVIFVIFPTVPKLASQLKISHYLKRHTKLRC